MPRPPLPSLLTPAEMGRKTHHPFWVSMVSGWPCCLTSLDEALAPQPWGQAGVHPCS